MKLDKEINMKYALVIFLLLSASLSGINLLTQNFSSHPNLPAGWTSTGPSQTVWSCINSNNAGGDFGELRLLYTPSSNGTYRFISPAFDTRRVHDMTLSFRHMLDDFVGNTNPYSLQMQMSSDLVNWSTLWSVDAGVASIPATQVSVQVGYAHGMSETTYLAVTFVGNNYDLNNWYVDDISLDYTNSLGFGNWETGTYFPEGHLFIPSGESLSLAPGTILRFSAGRSLVVHGNLQAVGIPSSPIVFASLDDYDSSTWGGIKIVGIGSTQDSTRIIYSGIINSNDSGLTISYSNKIRVHGCGIKFNDASSGGGVYLYGTDAILEENNIAYNISSGGAAALYCSSGNSVIRNNIFYENLNFNPVVLNNYNLDFFTGNSIICNDEGLKLESCTGTMIRIMIANNDGHGIRIVGANADGPTIQNCLIVNNGGGILNYGLCTINSSIIWGWGEFIITTSTTSITVKYSDVHGGQNNLGGEYITDDRYISNIDSDPLFVNPTTVLGSGQNPLNYDWNLQITSPCLDAGDPTLPLDEDLSVVDMGMYSLKLKPLITRLTDVSPDQGHQLDLRWERSCLDAGYTPQNIYSIWRQEAPRTQTRWIESPWELNDALGSTCENIAWRDGTRTWYYISQVPAVSFESYGLIVPTLQDSSSTGLHANQFMVMYHGSEGLFQAVPQSAYSVDNIPPAPARNPLIQALGTNQFQLSWTEVTEGLWEGNSYPELNDITYKVYGANTPDFEPGPASYIGSTNDPVLLISNGSQQRFFRIVVSDSE